MTAERFGYLTHIQGQAMDQFILRFTKLQDAMEGRLFPVILAYLQEPYEEQPILDKLNRLEKLGNFRSAEEWQKFRMTSMTALMTGAEILHYSIWFALLL